MLAVLQGSRPVTGVQPSTDRPVRGDPGSMVEFRGLLPKHTAEYLMRLSPKARRHVVVLMGVFKEVQALAGAGRQLHAYLQELPTAHWNCRITAQEVTHAKDGIFQAIAALRQKINHAAEEVCLILPRNHSPRMEEMNHGQIHHRVS